MKNELNIGTMIQTLGQTPEKGDICSGCGTDLTKKGMKSLKLDADKWKCKKCLTKEELFEALDLSKKAFEEAMLGKKEAEQNSNELSMDVELLEDKFEALKGVTT